MKTRKLYVTDAFTDRRFTGNRAGVVPDAAGLSDRLMQLVAAEVNASETAFIFPAGDADLALRFFTPAMEVPFCGHAFIASLATLALTGTLAVEGDFRRLKVRTNVGLHDAEVRPDGDAAIVTIFQADPLFRPNAHPADAICRALGLPHVALDPSFPIELAYTGLWHLLVGVKDDNLVRGAAPRYTEIKALNGEAGVHTTHLFARTGDGFFCRAFAPAAGIDEDPFTGSASGALGAYLVRQGAVAPGTAVALEQRDGTGRGGFGEVRVGGTREVPRTVAVTGKAVISIIGEVVLDESF